MNLNNKLHEPKLKLKSIFAKCKKINSCLEYQGAYWKRGYPQICYKKKQYKGHRLVLFLIDEVFENDKMCLHKCDNPKCLNPNHLYWGTAKDNAIDMYSRGRRKKYTHCPHGHEYTTLNTRMTKAGSKTCIICQNIRNKKIYDKIRKNVNYVRKNKIQSRSLHRKF